VVRPYRLAFSQKGPHAQSVLFVDSKEKGENTFQPALLSTTAARWPRGNGFVFEEPLAM